METNENKSLNINYGWKCPVCGRILAPWVPECPCNGFSNPRDITCRVKKLNASESILEGQMNHIPQIDSNFNQIPRDPTQEGLKSIDLDIRNIYPKVDAGNLVENKVDIPSFMFEHNKQIINDIMHKCINPFEGCKQTEGGGYIIDEPLIEARPIDKKNNIVSLNKFKKDKGDKK